MSTSVITFTLDEIHALAGEGHRPGAGELTPLDFACEALDSAVATLVLVSEIMGDDVPVSDAIYNARCRAEGAIAILQKIAKAERAGADGDNNVADLAAALASKARPGGAS